MQEKSSCCPTHVPTGAVGMRPCLQPCMDGWFLQEHGMEFQGQPPPEGQGDHLQDLLGLKTPPEGLLSSGQRLCHAERLCEAQHLA